MSGGLSFGCTIETEELPALAVPRQACAREGVRQEQIPAVLVGFLLIATEFVALYVFSVWEEWINVILGAWLVVSPWVLGVALVPTVNFVIVGLLVLALALYEIWDERRHTAHPA
jgi:hypothetical protein